MPYFYTEAEVDVDVSEFLDACNHHEIEQLIKYLKEDGYLGPLNTETHATSIMQESFNDALVKLQNVYYQLSNEEIELIQNIAKKF